MSRFRALLIGGVWLALLLVLDGAYLFREEHLRTQVGMLLTDTFGPDVRFGAVRRVEGGDLVIENVEIPDARDPEVALVSLDRIVVRLDWTRLFSAKLPVEDVLLDHARLTLRWDDDGELLFQSPFRSKESGDGGGEIPPIILSGLEVRLINAPDVFDPDVWFRLEKADVTLRSVSGAPGTFRIDAALRDDLVGNLNVEGRLAPSGLSLHVDRSGPPITPKLLGLLRPEWRDPLGKIKLGGAFDVYASVEVTGSEPARLRIESRMAEVTVVRDGWDPRIDGLRGRVVFENGKVRFEDFDGRLEGGRLAFAGLIDLTGPGEVRCSGNLFGLRLGPHLPPRLEPLGRLGDTIASQMRSFAIEGPVDVDFDLHVPSLQDALAARIGVTFREDVFRFMGALDKRTGKRRGIPLPLETFNGRVLFTDRGLTYSNITAMREGGDVFSRGWVDYQKRDHERWEVDIGIGALPLGESLWIALGPNPGDFLRSLHLGGRAYGRIRPTELAPPESDPLELDVELFDATARPDFFPYPMTGLSGRVALRGADVTLKGVRCPTGTGFFSLDGEAHTGGDAQRVELDLTAVHVPVDAPLLAALTHLIPSGRELFEAAAPGRGELSAALALTQADTEKPWEVRGFVELEALRFTLQDPDVTIEVPRVVLDLDGGEVRFREPVLAFANGLPLIADGFIREDGAVRVTARSRERDLGEALTVLLRSVPYFQDPAHRPDIEGEGELGLVLEVGGRDQQGRELMPRLVGSFSGLTVRPPGWKDTRVESLRGDVTWETDRLTVKNMTAFIPRPGGRSGAEGAGFGQDEGVDVSLKAGTLLFGRYADADGGLRWNLTEARLAGVPLEPWVVRALGLDMATLDAWGIPRVSGTVSLEVLGCLRDGPILDVAGGQLAFRDLGVARGEATAVRARLKDFGLAVTEESFDLVGDLLVQGFRAPRLGNLTADRLRVESLKISGRPKETTIKGALAFDLATVLALPISGLRAKVQGDGAGVRLTQLSGSVFGDSDLDSGGRLLPEATDVSYSWRTRRFTVRARVEDIPLGEAVRALGGDPGRFRGRGNAGLALSGDAGDSGSIVGNGRFAGSARNLIEIPVFLNVFRALDVVSLFKMMIRSGVPTEVGMDFAIRDRLVLMERVVLDNAAVGLDGKGSVTFDGIVSAYLDAEFKRGLPLVSDLLNLLPSLLAGGVTVQGSLGNPIVEVRPGDEGSEVGDRPPARRPITKPLKKGK